MRPRCEECGKRVYVVSRYQRSDPGRLQDHALCDRCYRSHRNQVVAARMLEKPDWAYRARSSLMMLNAETP